MIIGPPGSGKSRTIVALILQLLDEMPQEHVVILTSEKNGAVEAVAEHLHRACVSRDGKITDLAFFEKISAFGSTGMKEKTRSFVHDEKMNAHPEVQAVTHAEKKALNAKKTTAALCKAALRRLKEDEVLEFRDRYEYFEPLSLDQISLRDFRHLEEALVKAVSDYRVSKLSDEEEKCAILQSVLTALRPNLITLEHDSENHMKAFEMKELTMKAVDSRLKAGTRLMLATIGSLHKVHAKFV